jgi:uncharacterized protein with LGFP repeats
MSAIGEKHAQLPWIGNPKDEGAGADEGPLPDGRGRVQDFDNGSIYWAPETGAHEVHGAIRDKYGETRKWIGYPTTDETGCPDGVGRFNHFEHGSIYWTPTTGAREVHGAIRDLWASQGWERGPAGYPVSDEFNDPSAAGGRQSHFQRGVIAWDPVQGARFRPGVRID